MRLDSIHRSEMFSHSLMEARFEVFLQNETDGTRDNFSWDGGRGEGGEAGLDRSRWNHHVLKQCFMSGYRGKVAREVEGQIGEV